MATTIPIENAGQLWYLVLSFLAIAIPLTLVILRLTAKRILSRSFDASDYCIAIAAFFNTHLQIVGWIMVFKGGFGHHTSEIVQRFGRENLLVFYKCILAFSQLWHVNVCFSKLSVLFMYAALMPIPLLITIARGIGVFTAVWSLTSILTGLSMCRPFAFTWDLSIPGGTCGDWRVYYTVMGMFNVALDVVILLLPIPFLLRLQMAVGRKCFLVGIFSVGWMTCGITIYRQVILPDLDFADMTYTGLVATLFSAIEPASAIALACVPFLRPIFRGRQWSDKGSDLSRPNTDSRYGGGPTAAWELRSRKKRFGGRSKLATIDKLYWDSEMELKTTPAPEWDLTTRDDARSTMTRDDSRSVLKRDDAQSIMTTQDKARSMTTRDDALSTLSGDDARSVKSEGSLKREGSVKSVPSPSETVRELIIYNEMTGERAQRRAAESVREGRSREVGSTRSDRTSV